MIKKKFFHSLGPLFGIFLFAVAIWVLHHELREYHYHDVVRNLAEIPAHRLLLALALTILSYLIMTVYDALALRYIRHSIAYIKIALASFIGYAFSNNIGLSMIAGASVRYRLYSAWGLSALETIKVIIFCSLTIWLGFFTIGGIVFLFEPMVIPEALHLPFASVHYLGIIFIMLVGGYLLWSALRKKPLKIREWKFPLPSTRLSPLWNRLGTFVFRHGEHFYNFEGLRKYKEKFKPEWEPKYLAATGGLALPHILTNVASLISGGINGVIAK